MFELPLFPLNLVLFPMQSLALHIFEERYKQMIKHCIDSDMPFGVVLLEHGAAELERNRAPAEPYRVGCTAHITQVQPLPEGRMNIIVVGRDRFHIHDFKHDQPYLVGLVEYTPMVLPDSTISKPELRGLAGLMRRYLGVLEGGGRIQPGVRRLPSDPVMLTSLAAVMLHDIPVTQRQALLEADTLPQMVDDLRALFRREIVLLEAMLAEPEEDHLGSFSLN